MDPIKKWITEVSISWQEETFNLAILADTKLKKKFKPKILNSKSSKVAKCIYNHQKQ